MGRDVNEVEARLAEAGNIVSHWCTKNGMVLSFPKCNRDVNEVESQARWSWQYSVTLMYKERHGPQFPEMQLDDCLNKTETFTSPKTRKLSQAQQLNSSIPCVPTITIFGVHLDNVLSWEDQIKCVYKNIATDRDLLQQFEHFLPFDARKLFVNS